MNIWWVNVILFLLTFLIFNQFYKVLTKTSKSDGALTVLLQFFAFLSILFLIPFFEITFPCDIKVYCFLFLSIIFYAINNRLNTTVRRGLEASTFSILGQLQTVFMTIAGFVFFKEPFIWTKAIGALLIIFSNIFIFFKKGSFKLDKYVILGTLSNLSFTIAVFLDVTISGQFNLPLYIGIELIIPAILIFLFEKIKLSDVTLEFKNSNKKLVFITAICWSLNILFSLRAYLLGEVSTVAPLVSLNVILNIICSYFFLNEKENLVRKIIAGVFILISIILINL